MIRETQIDLTGVNKKHEHNINYQKNKGDLTMNTSTKTLPEGYTQCGEINLKKNKRLSISLNIASFFLFILCFYLLSSFAALVRPDLVNTSGSIKAGALAVLAGLMILLITIHELIHGFFFWVFTHSKPVFALRLFYAYAGAPDWYFPKRQFAIIAVGPLVIIGAVGLLLILLAPISWVMFIMFFVAMNTGGSMGDLYVLNRLFKLSPTGLINDTGDVITFYEHQSTISHT